MQSINLRSLAIAALTLSASFLPLKAEYLRLQAKSNSEGDSAYSQNIQLEAGDVCELLHFKADSAVDGIIVFCAPLGPSTCDPTSYTEEEARELNPVFVGPGSVYVITRNQPNSLATAAVKVTRASEGGEYLPTNTVVIPTDPAGNFKIILESSTDLINWVSAVPGTYPSETERRFFRVRAVSVPN